VNGGMGRKARARRPKGLLARLAQSFDLSYSVRRRRRSDRAPAETTSRSVPGSAASGGVEVFSSTVTSDGDRSGGGLCLVGLDI